MTCYLLVAIFSAVLGMFQFGFNSSSLNSPQKKVEQFLNETFKERYEKDLSSDQISTYFSIAVSMFLVGGMIGALSGGWVAEKFGRKRALIYTQVFSIFGAALMGTSKYANSYEMLVIGRILVGISAGLFTGLSPLYIAEIAPINIRGALGTVNQLGVTTGIFTAMVLGLENVLGGDETWPLLLALTAAPAILQCWILPFMPETPRYLILSKGKIEEAEEALKKLRNTDNVSSEVEEIQNEEQNSDNETNYSIWQLIKASELRLCLIVCISLHLSQQLSGMVAIFYYSTSFFESAGIDPGSAQYATIGVGAILVTMTLVTIPLMDRLGRRTLHLTGLAGIVICSIMITIALNFQEDGNEAVGIFLIVATLSFVVFFALGPGSIPWMAAGELFTQGPRAAAISVCVFVNWLGNLVVSLVFPQLQNSLTEFSFLPFSIITAILFVFLFFYFPETKNRTANELSKLFQVPNAWKTAIGFKKANVEKPLNTTSYVNYGSENTE